MLKRCETIKMTAYGKLKYVAECLITIFSTFFSPTLSDQTEKQTDTYT